MIEGSWLCQFLVLPNLKAFWRR